jgi:hypothetical protein
MKMAIGFSEFTPVPDNQRIAAIPDKAKADELCKSINEAYGSGWSVEEILFNGATHWVIVKDS